MTESEAPKFSWKDKRTIIILASIAGGTAIAAILLYTNKMGLASDNSPFELTNIFTFVIEIGIGVFISIMIFLYSKYQQDRMNKEQALRKEIFQKALINCLLSVWKDCTLIMLNLDQHGVREDLRNKPTFLEENKETADVIQMHKNRLSLDLQQLQTLIVLLGSEMDSKMISSLLDFHTKSFDNIMQTGIFRPPSPWSTMIIGIHRIIKKYFPASMGEFQTRELQHLLADEFKKEFMEGRTTSHS